MLAAPPSSGGPYQGPPQTSSLAQVPILIDAGPSPAGFHRLEAENICPSLFSFKENLSGKPGPDGQPTPRYYVDTSEPLLKGSLGHVGLAHHYARAKAITEGGDPNVYYMVDQAIAQLALKDPAYAQWVGLAQQAVADYAAEYAVEDRLWRILEVEQIHEAWVGATSSHPGYRYTSRFDLVVVDPADRVWIVDHKFVGRITKFRHEVYKVSGQFVAYHLFGAAAWGRQFGGVIANFIGWDAKPRVSRRVIEASPHMMATFGQWVVDTERRIESYKGRDPWHYPRAMSEQVCMRTYGKCDAWDLCRFGPSASQPK